MKLRWTEKASTDVLGIYDYIAAQAPGYAEVVCDRIFSRPQQLINHPRSGSIVPEYGREDIRELFVHSFRIIYRIVGSETRILTVVHGSRLLPSDTLDESER
jgi:addiction module RelE/StbE family toxin